MNHETENIYTDSETTENCPVTGMPIYSRPEWTDINLDENYSITFRFIGKKILLSFPRGEAGEKGVENFFKKRNEQG